MTRWSPFLSEAAKANERTCTSISSPHLLRPGRIMRWKTLSGFAGVSHLCPVSPHPLLSTSWATIPQSLLSIEPQIPPHTTCTQYISSPYLRPCLQTSLNPPLKSCPKPSPYTSHSNPAPGPPSVPTPREGRTRSCIE